MSGNAVAFGILCNNIASAMNSDDARQFLTDVGVSASDQSRLIPQISIDCARLFSELELRALIRDDAINDKFRSAVSKYADLNKLVVQCFDEKTLPYNFFQLKFMKVANSDPSMLADILQSLKINLDLQCVVKWTEIWAHLALIFIRFDRGNVDRLLAALSNSPHAVRFQPAIDLITQYEKTHLQETSK